MTQPHQFQPVLLHLNIDEAFFFAKLRLPEDAPPDWRTAVEKVILALKVARHIDTGVPLSVPLPENPPPLCGWDADV